MDGAVAGGLYIAMRPRRMASWVGGRGGRGEGGAWAPLKRPLVQILVVVANIQMRTLKTEVEKGLAWTAIGR